MHPLITIDDLAKLSDFDLVIIEARLRDLALCADLGDADLRRVLASLSNTIYLRSTRMVSPRP